MRLSKRYAAAVTAVLGAAAIAAPIGNASAATTPGTLPGWDLSALASLPGVGSLPDFASLPGYGVSWSLDPFSFIDPSSFDASIGGTTFSRGPTVVDSVFNGATVVQVNNGASASSVVASP